MAGPGITLHLEGDTVVAEVEYPKQSDTLVIIDMAVSAIDRFFPETPDLFDLTAPHTPFMAISIEYIEREERDMRIALGSILRDMPFHHVRPFERQDWHLRNQTPRSPLQGRVPRPTRHRRVQRVKNH
ncbi:MAG TPA: hypothetical protein VHD31_03150 [Candidatus Paceibacterota bacterium]|nr:hypothetical protein [Candidatus Paceibacterota bacterium]